MGRLLTRILGLFRASDQAELRVFFRVNWMLPDPLALATPRRGELKEEFLRWKEKDLCLPVQANKPKSSALGFSLGLTLVPPTGSQLGADIRAPPPWLGSY